MKTWIKHKKELEYVSTFNHYNYDYNNWQWIDLNSDIVQNYVK